MTRPGARPGFIALAAGLDPVLSETDMVAFNDPGAFQAVVFPVGSFALVVGRERAAAALRDARQSLAVGKLRATLTPKTELSLSPQQ